MRTHGCALIHINMVVITVGERERAQVLVRLAGRNKHTLAFWMAPRLQMAFRAISLTRNQTTTNYYRYWRKFLSGTAVH